MVNNHKKKVKQMGFDGLGTFLLSNLLIVVTFGVTVSPALFYVILLAIKSRASTQSNTLLVLGERLQNNSPGHNYIARLERAYSVFRLNKNRKIFIVGGLTGDATISESASGENYLLNKQVPPSSMHIENESQHTLENLKNVRDMLTGNSIDTVGIVTNRFHLARASVLATGLGIKHDLCAAEENFQNTTKQWLLVIREAYFIHWYFTGKYWSILTNNQSSLERIR